MFTGIVTALGTIRSISPLGGTADMRLAITAPWPDTGSIAIGASIGCSGCCLTAVEVGPDWFAESVKPPSARGVRFEVTGAAVMSAQLAGSATPSGIFAATVGCVGSEMSTVRTWPHGHPPPYGIG